MRVSIIAAVAAIGTGFASPSAHAIGCISGGIAGAAAGHLAHHGVLGAIGGCIAGHEYHKNQEEQRYQSQQYGHDQYPNGYGRTNP